MAVETFEEGAVEDLTPPAPPAPPVRTPYAVRNLLLAENGCVDCEIEHPEAGWIPFTANPVDKEVATLDVFAYIASEEININALPVSPQVKVNQELAERDLRDRELSHADLMINKIEDFEIEGDSRPWRQYRVALRNWPASEFFPNPDKRPVSPE